MSMLHAIKAMIWQALQTLKEPTEDVVKRSKLQVLSHNLSAEGLLGELVKSFDAAFQPDVDKVDCKRYLDTAIHEAVSTLTAKSEKEQKICVERVHEVCWQLCKVQLKGVLPSLLTEESTKIWWKIFNTFAERDSENARIRYPVVMDWEEVDYWANVVLKVMALNASTQSRREREVMGATTLNFQDALVRFNAKLNENNGMFVLDQQGKPDLKYIEHSMQELNVRLFEGIHLNGSLLSITGTNEGSLLSIKKNHSHTKWCVLYQKGLAFANSPAEVDSTNPSAFFPIGASTEVVPMVDKNQRPVRFQLSNGPQDTKPRLFEANNVSLRNKWITAIICLKHSQLPDYVKDFVNRRKIRIKNRDIEAEAKENLRKQKEKTKKQMDAMSQAMEQERQRHETEADLRNATAEELRAKIGENDCRMAALMRQMTELGQQYEQEKATMAEHHERELQQLVRQHGDQIGCVQTELETELSRQREQMELNRAAHRDEIAQKDAEIAKLEAEVARLNGLLESLTLQAESTASQHRSQSEQAAAQLAAQLEANNQLRDEAQRLATDAGQMRERIQAHEDLRQRWEADHAAVERLTGENAELKEKSQLLESAASQHRSQSEQAAAQLAAQLETNSQLRDEAQKLATDAAQMREQIRVLVDLRQRWEEDHATIERLTEENAVLSEKSKQLETQMRRLKTPGPRRLLIDHEFREEDQVLLDAIFAETGFDPEDQFLNESFNDFKILTIRGQGGQAYEVPPSLDKSLDESNVKTDQ